MENFFQKIKAHWKFWLVFAATILFAIFLRTYDHSDLLRFGKDQARDAAIIRDIIAERQPLPLIGPRAYGTEFKMGPIFYYFQYASARIFGTEPDKMAYPDLLFSILTIPVLYLFLRKYFGRNIALSLTALYAVSFFAVQNGRFAWNPNSLPLFSILFLYALLELSDSDSRKKILWSILGGVALGIGVQLHTLFILVMSIFFILYCAYFFQKKPLPWKNLAIIFSVAIFLNLPQLISEIKTGGQNSRAFLAGITQKTQVSYPFPTNILMAGTWHLQANALFIAPLGTDSKSDFYATYDDIRV
jgi:4-amino-4-deoxy-L-arabinose transferase-like glycosyltransferase